MGPQDVEAHFAFLRHVTALLKGSGELGGDAPAAADAYAEAARRATNVAERDHLVGRAARARRLAVG